LSLAKNEIKSLELLSPIFKNIGTYILNEKELEEYKEKEK